MSDARRKVLDMVEQGKITSEEGDKLLSAMNGKKGFGFRSLFDPYERIGTTTSLIVGVLVAAASLGVASFFDVRFDGFMDLHMGIGDVSLSTAAIDQAIAWPVSALILWLVALPFARKSRFIDFLGALGVARVLQLVAGVALPPLTPDVKVMERMAADPISSMGELAGMIPMIIVAVVLISWFVATMVFAFRHASGLRRGKLALAFVIGILVTEALTKVAVSFVS